VVNSRTPDSALDLTASRVIVGEAITKVVAPAALVVGLALLVVGAMTNDQAALRLGGTGVVVGILGWLEHAGYLSSPLLLLMAAVSGCAVSVPVVGIAGAMAVLAALTLLALVGVFSLSRVMGALYFAWCGAVLVFTITQTAGDVGLGQGLLAALVLLAVGVAGWRALTMVRDELINGAEAHRLLYDSSPVALLVEDFTDVKVWLDDLRASGVQDIRGHLERHPDAARHGASLISIKRANAEAVTMVGAESGEGLITRFGTIQREDHELVSFIEQFVAIWHGRRSLALDLHGSTLDGLPIEAVLHWSVPVSGGRSDLSRVQVAISDVTPRKIVEERLARAVEENERLLTMDRALAACSRALLLGAGEDALEVALEALRTAIGADRAFLALNVEDPGVGPSFRVVNSASAPEHAQDDWIGMSVPWSKYPMAHDPLSRGEPFQHLAAESEGEGWRRSLLVVPVFTNGTWSGTVGFVDIDRRTHWTDDAVRMLEVASPMLGNFWERELTRRRLEELVESKDRFVATISHELRTPLSAVLGFAEELKNQASSLDPLDATEILELIAEQSRDMADMVEDLLVAARAEIGTVSISPEVVYLRAQAEAAVVALGSPGAMTFDVVGGPGKAWVDPTRTRQIIRNLLTNAVRYGGSEVVIQAATNEAMNTTTLTVRDSGRPLEREQWERIFEPYERSRDRDTAPDSVGLGLSVSRQLARLMGGDLVYRGDEGDSVFELTVPAEPVDLSSRTMEDNPGVTTASASS
jgi:signal transduction histidine kinase